MQFNTHWFQYNLVKTGCAHQNFRVPQILLQHAASGQHVDAVIGTMWYTPAVIGTMWYAPAVTWTMWYTPCPTSHPTFNTVAGSSHSQNNTRAVHHSKQGNS